MEKARLFLQFLGTRRHKGLKLMNHLTTGGTAGSLKTRPYDEPGYCSSKTITVTTCCAARRAWPWQQPPSRNRQKTRPSSGLGVGVASESRRPKPCKGNERKDLGENRGRRLPAGEAGAWGCGAGNLLSPERRRCAVERIMVFPLVSLTKEGLGVESSFFGDPSLPRGCPAPRSWILWHPDALFPHRQGILPACGPSRRYTGGLLS